MFWIKKFLILLTGLSILMTLGGCAGAERDTYTRSTITDTTMPVMTTSPETQTSLPAVVKTMHVVKPIVTATIIAPTTPVLSNASELLKNAIANLQNAASFQIVEHTVTAYQSIDVNGTIRRTYGEFNTNYAVIRLPMLKVHADYKYRYDPQADFATDESYAYQEKDTYFIRRVGGSNANAVEKIDFQQIEPMTGDVYQTVITYSDQAKFVTESNGIAVYTFEHPEWYKMKGAIGFADLGFLYMQENGEELVKQYVAEKYSNVKPIRFMLYIAVNKQAITKVVVDNNDFMISILAEVNLALIKHGANPQDLPVYKIMDVNRAEYLFSNYNQVQDFKIP